MILRSSNQSDLHIISKYGKAKGILQLIKVFPELSPFKEIILVDNLDELKKISKFLPANYIYRQDAPIGSSNEKNIVKSGNKDSIIDYFTQVKSQNENGVLLILPCDIPNLPRLISNGAFSVSFNKGRSISIEFVGKGFDARELTRGIACHETYVLPWDMFLFCSSVVKMQAFKLFSVNEAGYLNSRETRSEFLQKIGTKQEDIEYYLPKEYISPPNYVKEKILNQIVLPMFIEMETNLENRFNSCWVCGNITSDNIVMPYELSTAERVVSNFVKNKKNELVK